MSRIGRAPITVPAGVEITVGEDQIEVLSVEKLPVGSTVR